MAERTKMGEQERSVLHAAASELLESCEKLKMGPEAPIKQPIHGPIMTPQEPQRMHPKDMRLLLAGMILSGFWAGRWNGEESRALEYADDLMREAEKPAGKGAE